MSLNKIKLMLLEEEGTRTTPYKDSLGVWTLGVGHNLNNPISARAIETILEDDITDAVKTAQRVLGRDEFRALHLNRQLAIINMAFQLGESRLSGFQKMLKAIRNKDWKLAAIEALNSKWAKQTPERALRVAEMLKEACWPY